HDPPTHELHTLSLHDALPIYLRHATDGTRTATERRRSRPANLETRFTRYGTDLRRRRLDAGQHHRRRELVVEQARLVREHVRPRSEEHTSELQSRENLVCRLL